MHREPCLRRIQLVDLSGFCNRTLQQNSRSKDCSYSPIIFSPSDPHGKDCSYNPIAFPPSVEVRVGSAENAICPWMDGQTFAPAISALPPSVVVVLGQRICTGRTVVGQRRSSCEELSRSNFLPWWSDIFTRRYKSITCAFYSKHIK